MVKKLIFSEYLMKSRNIAENSRMIANSLNIKNSVQTPKNSGAISINKNYKLFFFI